MLRAARLRTLLAASLLAGAVHAQPSPGGDLQALCAAQPARPAAARELAIRAHCVLVGLVSSERRYAEAQELARRSLQLGDPAGAYLLYAAFTNDPRNTYLRDGAVDMEAYRRLGARPIEQRRDQAEAIDALAFAAGKGHVNAAMVLASYLRDTSAPQNVARLRGLTALLLRNGEKSPKLERLAQEAALVERSAPGTKASVRAFGDAYQLASAAATTAAGAQRPEADCARPALQSVSSGEIADARYLPLTSPSVKDSYLVQGEWSELWTFSACGVEVPVRVRFRADGWGGVTFTAAAEKPN